MNMRTRPNDVYEVKPLKKEMQCSATYVSSQQWTIWSDREVIRRMRIAFYKMPHLRRYAGAHDVCSVSTIYVALSPRDASPFFPPVFFFLLCFFFVLLKICFAEFSVFGYNLNTHFSQAQFYRRLNVWNLFLSMLVVSTQIVCARCHNKRSIHPYIPSASTKRMERDRCCALRAFKEKCWLADSNRK